MEAQSEIKIDTPWGKKNWSFVRLCLATHQELEDACRHALNIEAANEDSGFPSLFRVEIDGFTCLGDLLRATIKRVEAIKKGGL